MAPKAAARSRRTSGAPVELSPAVRLVVASVRTPLGGLRLVAAGNRLCAAEFDDCDDRLALSLRRRWGRHSPPDAGRLPPAVTRAIREYFRGDVTAIDELEVDLAGTPFQQALWTTLRTVSAGSTLTYAEMAARLGCPAAARAVGHANGANPLSVVVPCHRLVGSNGSLTGYGGGLHRKHWLLAHEARHARLRTRHA
jgi:methylated-DNA-[protein]-cysteine S-methyltransferase